MAVVRILMLAVAALLAPLLPPARALAQEPPVHLRIVGGLAEISQYVNFEQPFWQQRLREVSGGRLTAEIVPFDRSGLRAQDLLSLMRLGVVSFGTVLLGPAAADEPEFNIVDLPALSPDIPALRANVARVRPYLERILAERHNIDVLAVYTYPAQVVFCRRPFAGLGDLAGRRVRTSGVAQSELVAALGAVPVILPFAEVVPAIRGGVVECAITGTLSGNAIGLHEVTSHVHAMSLSWGVSVFGVSRGAWEALPADLREVLRAALARLESEIWEGAERETGQGLLCNSGQPACSLGRPGRMTVVPVSAEDRQLSRSLLREHVVPRWIGRCGPECAESWNRHMADAVGFRVPVE